MRLNTFWTDHKMIKHLVNMDFMTVSSKSTILTSLCTTRQIKSIGVVICLRHHINFCTRASIKLQTGCEIIGFYMTSKNSWCLFKCTVLLTFHPSTPFNTYKSMEGNCCFSINSRVSSRSCCLGKQVNGFGQVSHLHSTSCTAQWRFESLEFEELMGLSLGMALVPVLGGKGPYSRTVQQFDLIFPSIGLSVFLCWKDFVECLGIFRQMLRPVMNDTRECTNF